MTELPRTAGWGGAVDLSEFARKASEAKASSTGGGQSQNPAASPTGSASALKISVPALVLDVTAETLGSFVKVSESLPVLVNFTSSRSESSADLTRKLTDEVNKRNGALVMLCIDGDSSAQLLQMFQIQSIPAVAAILKGQPAPLFVGDQEPTVIAQILDKVITLGVSNGLAGVAVVDENAEPPKQELPPRVQAAYDAVDSGDYARAVVEFEAALAESPANKLAITGLAQAKFLVRSQNIEVETVLTKPAQTLQDVLDKSDALMAMGHFDKAFEAVLDTFAVADKDDREVLRTHLLELFKVAGEADQLVSAARARLASLLY